MIKLDISMNTGGLKMINKSTVEKIISFNKDRDWDQFHSPENLSKSIVIEAAELLENFQWDDNIKMDKVEEELADVFMYAFMLANKLDIDVEKIILQKLEKNGQKYSIENSKGNSKKYTEFE